MEDPDKCTENHPPLYQPPLKRHLFFFHGLAVLADHVSDGVSGLGKRLYFASSPANEDSPFDNAHDQMGKGI
jgi:hypothetical protein